MNALKQFTLQNFALSAALLVGSGAALAVTVPPGLSITGTVTLDTTNSFDPTGGATQSGTLKQVIGGATTTSGFSDTPSSIITSSLGGALTDIGDGIGASFSMSGTYVDTAMTTDGLFADFTLDLVNNTATVTYTVTFAAVIANSVGAAGDDAYAQSMISVFDGANDEVLFSDYRIDTLNTDANSNFEAASANSTFSVTLAPGESVSFTALQKQLGGVYAAGSYSADLDAFVRIESVVPELGALPMMGLGLLALALTQRRRRAG